MMETKQFLTKNCKRMVGDVVVRVVVVELLLQQRSLYKMKWGIGGRTHHDAEMAA
jgi:hypothetical protein